MTNKHQFNPLILRAYDIRGIVGKTLFNEDAYFLGKAISFILANSRINGPVSIGYDGRLTSKELSKHLTKGFLESGINVIDIGLVPTPILYFSSIEFKAAAAIMITGSHNPPDYNGFKIMIDGKPFYGDDIQNLAQIVNQETYGTGKGILQIIDIKNKYLHYLIEHYASPLSDKLSIAWDPGNGATGETIAQLIKRLPGKHFIINEIIDGTFPAHHPDPSVAENLNQLMRVVKDNKCDFGIAFDGDGDRLGVIDKEGEIITGDKILYILAKDLLSRHPNSKIVMDVKTSDIIFEAVKQIGGIPIMWKTGHSFIKTKMKEEKALLAGEMSGHIFFGEDYYNFDDAILAACKLIMYISRMNVEVSQLIAELPKTYGTSEIKIEVDESEKFALVEQMHAILKKDNKEFSDLDGVRVKETDGWWLLRASNTQNVLIVRIEAKNNESLLKISEQLCRYCASIGLSTTEIENGTRNLSLA